jgi:hypothetical protein
MVQGGWWLNMRAEYVFLGILMLLLALSPSLAATIEVTQSGADSGTVMKGQVFTLTVSGLSGSGTVSLLDTPSGFSSEEGLTKSFSEGTTSVTWTTAKISELQNAISLKASVSVQGSPSIAQSSSFNVVLPPSITLTADPPEATVNKGSSYSVTLNVQNLGGTSAKSVSFSVSGSGMSASCTPISSVAAGSSSSTICSVSAATAGTITTTFTANPSNCDSKSDSVLVTVQNTGSNQNNNNAPSGGGGGGAGLPSFWTSTITIADQDFVLGISKALSETQRLKVKVGTSDHYIGIISMTGSSVTINVSSTPQQAVLQIGEEKKFDVSSDGYYEISVKLSSITNNTANITVMQIYEKVSNSGGSSGTGENSALGQTTTETITHQGCAEGSMRCQDNDLQICSNGEWTDQELCSYGCDASLLSCKAASNDAGLTTQTSSNSNWVLYGLVIIILIAVLAYFIRKRTQKKGYSFQPGK